jgi:hypothetical protein
VRLLEQTQCAIALFDETSGSELRLCLFWFSLDSLARAAKPTVEP